MKKRLKQIVIAVTTGVLLASVSACASVTAVVPTTEAETTEAEEVALLWGEVEERELYSLYIKLNHVILGQVESIIDRYFSYVEFQEEFALKDKSYSMLSVSKYIREDVEFLRYTLRGKAVLNGLDRSYLALYPKLIEIIDCLNEIDGYADLSTFLDDDFAKAAEFHQELWGMYGEYEKLTTEVQMQFEQYSTTYLNNILEQAESDGDQVLGEAVTALLAAKAIDAEFRAQEVSDENLLEADLERLQPLYEEFLVHVNAMLDQSKQPDFIKNAYEWEDYLDSVKETKTSMTMVLGNIRENKKPSIISSSAGNGSLESFRVGLKEMVTEFDRLPQAATVPETTTKTAAPALSPWTEDDEMELYNAYVYLYNFLGSTFDRALECYFSDVEFQEEFVRTKKDYYTYSFSKGEFDKIDKIHKLLAKKAEYSAVDEAFLQINPSVKGVMTAINEIYEYTDMKSYMDDDYAKGAGQHAELWGQLMAYQDNIGSFRDMFLDESAVRRSQSLEQLKKDGFEVLYAVNLVIDSAQAIQNQLYVQGINDDNMVDMDLEVIEPLYEEFITHVDLVLSYINDEEQLAQEGFTAPNVNWSMFVTNMKDTRSSLTQVMAKARDKEPLSDGDRMITWAGNCSLASFDSGVSSMVTEYNRMIK